MTMYHPYQRTRDEEVRDETRLEHIWRLGECRGKGAGPQKPSCPKYMLGLLGLHFLSPEQAIYNTLLLITFPQLFPLCVWKEDIKAWLAVIAGLFTVTATSQVNNRLMEEMLEKKKRNSCHCTLET